MKITVAGSICFADEFNKAKETLQGFGHEVTVPEKDPLPEPIPASAKREAMDKFSAKLKNADAVLVMNFTKGDKPNYIGANAMMEIGMAFILEKKIFVLNPFPDFCAGELEAMGAICLHGDLSQIK